MLSGNNTPLVLGEYVLQAKNGAGGMGLARLDDSTAAVREGLTQSGQVMGTVDYMAPEQAFDTLTKKYGLGVL